MKRRYLLVTALFSCQVFADFEAPSVNVGLYQGYEAKSYVVNQSGGEANLQGANVITVSNPSAVQIQKYVGEETKLTQENTDNSVQALNIMKTSGGAAATWQHVKTNSMVMDQVNNMGSIQAGNYYSNQ